MVGTGGDDHRSGATHGRRDTFEMAGVGVIRLADINAPEMAQKCQGGPKELRDCGAFVADVLAGRI